MLVHNVFFWLRKDLDGDQVTEFRMGLEACDGVTGVGAAVDFHDGAHRIAVSSGFQSATGLKIGFWNYLQADKDINNQARQRSTRLSKIQSSG